MTDLEKELYDAIILFRNAVAIDGTMQSVRDAFFKTHGIIRKYSEAFKREKMIDKSEVESDEMKSERIEIADAYREWKARKGQCEICNGTGLVNYIGCPNGCKVDPTVFGG